LMGALPLNQKPGFCCSNQPASPIQPHTATNISHRAKKTWFLDAATSEPETRFFAPLFLIDSSAALFSLIGLLVQQKPGFLMGALPLNQKPGFSLPFS